ncbi:MAG: AraC family transcriptional regulator ligand-binding domain-containing protein [Bauldia sp.]|nr:AraC family transcriptional regulator ligand-binding domain-containing protein [Bauldia sp.]
MARPSVGFTRASGFGPLPRLFEAAEGAPALRRLLAGEGLTPGTLSPRTVIPFSSLNEVFNQASRLSGDTLFPLHVAQAMKPEDYGPYVQSALAAPTLMEAIRRLRGFAELQTNAMTFELRRNGREAFWSLHYLAARGHKVDHHALHVLVPMVRFVTRYTGLTRKPTALLLASAAAPFHSALETALEVPVRADAGVFSLVFPADWLALPNPGGSKVVPTVADLLAYYRENALPRSTSDAVAAMLLPRVGEPEIDLDMIAERLAVGRRTLQQRLSAEGTSFRDIALRLRMERAKQLMAEDDSTIAQVALAVGYSDQAHFTRAFKTATNMTPREFRRLRRPSLLMAAE